MGKLYTSPFLNVATVKAPMQLTVAGVRVEEVGKEREKKDVLFFTEIEQGLVLGAATKRALIDMAGDNDTDKMVGLKVEVYVNPDIEMGGKRVGGVRVRAAKK